MGGAGEDVGELSVNCGWGFSIVGVQPRQWNSSVGQPQHEVRRFRYVSNFCTKSRLRVTVFTVRTHIANLRRKLGANDRFEAVMTALRLGILELR